MRTFATIRIEIDDDQDPLEVARELAERLKSADGVVDVEVLSAKKVSSGDDD